VVVEEDMEGVVTEEIKGEAGRTRRAEKERRLFLAPRCCVTQYQQAPRTVCVNVTSIL